MISVVISFLLSTQGWMYQIRPLQTASERTGERCVAINPPFCELSVPAGMKNVGVDAILKMDPVP